MCVRTSHPTGLGSPRDSVRPPKKSWKKIFNLSGGEKTLSSLALVFALHHYKPTPLYFMDEIDAALDFKNVSIVACYIYVSTTRWSSGQVVRSRLFIAGVADLRDAPWVLSQNSSS